MYFSSDALLLGSTGGGGGSEENASSDETFTAENYGTLVANPEAYSGARVEITGQLLGGPEQSDSEVAFQMWADPVKVDWNTLVLTDESSLDLRGDDYVRVEGIVLGAFDGENRLWWSCHRCRGRSG